MSAIFQTVPGRIVAVETTEAESFVLQVERPGSADISTTGITTAFEINQAISAQFQTTLDQGLFVVPFGDDVGRMQLSLIHGQACPDTPGLNQDGLNEFMAWYKANKLQAGVLNPLTIAFGESVFAGYVISMQMGARATEGTLIRSNLNLVAWSLQ